MGSKLCTLTPIHPESFIHNNDTLKACALTSRSPQTHTVRYTDTQLDTHRHRAQGRMEPWGYRMGLRRDRIGSPTGHHFLLLLGAVGGEVLGDDVCVLEEHITDGLGRTQME